MLSVVCVYLDHFFFLKNFDSVNIFCSPFSSQIDLRGEGGREGREGREKEEKGEEKGKKGRKKLIQGK